MKKYHRFGKGVGRAFAPISLALFTLPASIPAQSTNQVSPEQLNQVLQRLQQDEQEINKLSQFIASHSLTASPSPAASPAATNNFAALQQRLDAQSAAFTSLQQEVAKATIPALNRPKYPNLQFHGFADIDYAADNRRPKNVPGNATGIPYGVSYYGIKNTFYIGEMDIFLSSQLSPNTSFVSETAFSADSNNQMGVDIERLYLEYRHNEYFNVEAGRLHTDLGYYNTTYHHGLWLQTAVGRPSFLQFEDSGGIMPIHLVGLEVHGAIPSGRLNLSYDAELGNGEDFTANTSLNDVQQIVSFNDSKAFNLALEAKPDWLPGLQFGGNLYYDFIIPDNAGTTNNVPHNNQAIFGANVVYNNADWEFLNEGYLILDKPTGGQAHYDPAFYTQIGRRVGPFTPYFRFTYYDIAKSDSLYSLDWNGGVNAGLHYGPSLGVRYDFTTYAALKVQYDYLVDTGLNDASRVTVQASCTF